MTPEQLRARYPQGPDILPTIDPAVLAALRQGFDQRGGGYWDSLDSGMQWIDQPVYGADGFAYLARPQSPDGRPGSRPMWDQGVIMRRQDSARDWTDEYDLAGNFVNRQYAPEANRLRSWALASLGGYLGMSGLEAATAGGAAAGGTAAGGAGLTASEAAALEAALGSGAGNLTAGAGGLFPTTGGLVGAEIAAGLGGTGLTAAEIAALGSGGSGLLGAANAGAANAGGGDVLGSWGNWQTDPSSVGNWARSAVGGGGGASSMPDWARIATGVLGAAAGASDAQDRQNTQTTTTTQQGTQNQSREPWAPAQEALRGMIGWGANLAGQRQQQPFSPQQQTAYNNIGGLLNSINQGAPGLLSGFGAAASGANNFDRSNPRRQLRGGAQFDMSNWGPGLLSFFPGGR